MELSNFQSPVGGGTQKAPTSAAKARMVQLGFPEEWAEVSLSRCSDHLENAILFCYDNGAEMDRIVVEEQDRRRRLGVGSVMPPAPPTAMNLITTGITSPEARDSGHSHGHKHGHKHGGHTGAKETPLAESKPKEVKSKPAEEEGPKDIYEQIREITSSTTFFLTSLWLGWLGMGTLFYGVNNGYKFGQAFYMSVNVGYSIGWGYPADPSHGSKVFSVFYVLMGSSAISAALGMFANKMVADNDSWYEDAIQLAEFKKTLAEASNFKKVLAWIEYNFDKLRPLFFWFLWVFVAVVWSMSVIKWPFVDALYFAISSMSTGGLWAIPADAPDWQYGLVGAFAATGCPLMALAMAEAASFFIKTEDPEETTRKILSPVTMEEIEMMNKFGLENGDGEVDKSEYIILCMVRIGAVTPQLVEEVINNFNKLDASGDGTLTYAELMEDHSAMAGHDASEA